jgi:hypothetical protein
MLDVTFVTFQLSVAVESNIANLKAFERVRVWVYLVYIHVEDKCITSESLYLVRHSRYHTRAGSKIGMVMRGW